MSNTKLTTSQKNERKSLKGHWIDNMNGFFHTAYGVTLLMVVDDKMTRISVSITSEEEVKFRYKVGEYHALMRMERNQYIMMPTYKTSEDALDNLCQVLSLTFN